VIEKKGWVFAFWWPGAQKTTKIGTLRRKKSGEWGVASSGMGIVDGHPGSFPKSGKQRSCGIRRMGEFVREAGKGLAGEDSRGERET